jgi:hypothetical protein
LEKVRKYLEKSGLARMGVSVRAYFIVIKDFLAFSSHLI